LTQPLPESTTRFTTVRTISRCGDISTGTRHVIEHDWRRQAEEQTLVGDELIGWHVYLDVPAEIVHSLREWLDHRDRRDRPTAILKRIPRTPASTRRLSSAFVTVVSSTLPSDASNCTVQPATPTSGCWR